MEKNSETIYEHINIEIWIASHIHSQQRFEWAKEMLLSLNQQTDKDFLVCFSYSQEPYIDGDIGELAVKLLDGSSTYIRKHENRKTQFEHIEFLASNKYTFDKKTFILFCDDDDMYHRTRVERMRSIITQFPDTKFFKDYSFPIQGKDVFDTYGEEILWDSYGRVSILKMGNNEIFKDFANNICDINLIITFFEQKLDKKYIEENPKILGLLDCAFSGWLSSFCSTENSDMKEVLYLKRIERNFESKPECWDKRKDFDFTSVIDEWNLKKVFFEMSKSF